MSQTTQAELDHLTASVTVPAFFAKVAADTGMSIPDAQTAHLLRVLSDRVDATCTAYLTKQANAVHVRTADVVKQAAEALGVGTKPAAAPTADNDFLRLPGVKEAAEKLVAIEKAAAEGCATTPTVPPAVEEEEEEKKVPAAPAV